MTEWDKKRLGGILMGLVHAASNNDWGQMQQAQNELLRFNPDVASRQKTIEEFFIGFDSIFVPPHCKHCGEMQDRHIGGKCLFDACMFTPCAAKVSPLELEQLRLGNFINAIREHRARTGAGLKDSKDFMEAERARHPQWRRQVP